MMKILQRSWDILWKYRTLWIFGFILAMTVGGNTFKSSGGPGSYQTNRQEVQNYLQEPWSNQTFRSPQDFFDWLKLSGNDLKGLVESQIELRTTIWIGIVFIILMVLTGIGMTILRYVSETATIRMVDNLEESGEEVPFKQGFRMGWSKRSWRLFLVDLLLLFLPGLITASLLILIGWGTFATIISGENIMAAGIFLVAGVVFFLILVMTLYFVLISFLRNFIVRSCVIEDAGVGESIKMGFNLVRESWKDAGMMWLVMIGMGIAWVFVSILLLIVLIPAFVVSAVLGVVAGGIPGAIVGLLSSLFIPSRVWVIVIGVLIGLPFFLLIALSPFLFVDGLVQVFKSTVWTLVYREIKPKELGKPIEELAEA
ncbi:MAG TPA: hypothetical protein VJZ78_04565 [Anaerolineales bacterium]|nr:hypothetical protein [Anaerolineales bacterium]